MSDFNDLKNSIDDGIQGKAIGIPFRLEKLNSVTSGIRPRINVLIGGFSGTGKTALVDYVYPLGIYEYLLQNPDSLCTAEILYFSMERSKKYKLAKWLAVKLYEDHGLLFDVPDILGWQTPGKMKDFRELIESYNSYFEGLLKIVTIFEGSQNPTGIFKAVDSKMKTLGTIEQVSEFSKVYHPNNENHIVIAIHDHIGKVKKEQGFTKKQSIDKLSEYNGYTRDFYGVHNVEISQFNRDISNPIRLKMGDVEPQSEDFKETGEPFENADCVLALFNPMRYKIFDHMNYDIKKFVSPTGQFRFRSIKIIKNTYGIDDAKIASKFVGEVGAFEELPKAEEFEKDPKLYEKIMK